MVIVVIGYRGNRAIQDYFSENERGLVRRLIVEPSFRVCRVDDQFPIEKRFSSKAEEDLRIDAAVGGALGGTS
jgi:hypothetical protein